MCQILLVRPGQTDFDCQDRVQGSLDLPLNHSGQQEVADLAGSLKDQSIDLILSGPSSPSLATAQVLAESLDLPHKSCEGLKNVSQGLWEGLEIVEVKRKFPSVYKHWKESPGEVSIPNAEPTSEAKKRIEKVLKKYEKKKLMILIVAAEPLASLIACIVEGRKLCLTKHETTTDRCQVQALQQQL